MQFKLEVTAQTARSLVPHLRDQLKRARTMLPSPLRQMSLILVNDDIMSDLHQRFMNIPRPTDVLTFPIDVDERGRATSGEVYVSVPEARRRAKQQGTRVENELLLYALHGMLHLSGLDDKTPTGFQHMHRTEDRILSRLGVGPVFQPKSSRTRTRTRTQTRAKSAAGARRARTRAANAKPAATAGARR